MITIYQRKAIPKNMQLIHLNDIYFNKYTANILDSRAVEIIKRALNIIYHLDHIFDICECGDNALDVIYSLPDGNVYCSYPFISFEMKSVNVCDKYGTREIDSYEALKEWWMNED